MGETGSRAELEVDTPDDRIFGGHFLLRTNFAARQRPIDYLTNRLPNQNGNQNRGEYAWKCNP